VAIRAVVFDIGGVLFDWNLRTLYAKIIPDPARLDWFLSHVVTPAWHFQHDAGRDFADTSAELIAEFPAEADLIRTLLPRFRETIGDPIPGMHALIAELDAAGVPLFCITNFSHELFPPFRADQAALFDRFRDIVVSGDEKLAKPDPAIYALALERFGLGADEAVFIDDVLANAESADRCGFVGHHFQGVEGVRARLSEMGLPT
jgi:2-haloacid dehalogenase